MWDSAACITCSLADRLYRAGGTTDTANLLYRAKSSTQTGLNDYARCHQTSPAINRSQTTENVSVNHGSYKQKHHPKISEYFNK